jgi:hypothetical protein
MQEHFPPDWRSSFQMKGGKGESPLYDFPGFRAMARTLLFGILWSFYQIIIMATGEDIRVDV